MNNEDIEMNDGDQINSISEMIIMHDKTAPFSTLNMVAGSLITIKGGPVMFESDKPLECMTLTYD